MTTPPPAKGKAAPTATPPELERIATAIEEVAAALACVDEAITGDLDFDLATYGMLQDLINVAKDSQAIVGSALVGTVPNRFESYPVPGGGTFKIGGGKERKSYDQDRLVSAAAEKILEQTDIAGIVTDDGEHIPGSEAVVHAIREFATFTGCLAPSFDGWRSTAAKAYGINLKDYCELVTSPITTRIEGRRPAI